MLAQVLRCTSCAGDLEAHPPTRSPSNRWLCATHIGQQSCRHRLRVKKARSASPFSRSIMLPLNLREDCPRRRRQEWIWSEPLGRAARPSSTAQTPTATGPPWDTTAAIAEAFLARGARTDGRARVKFFAQRQRHLFRGFKLVPTPASKHATHTSVQTSIPLILPAVPDPSAPQAMTTHRVAVCVTNIASMRRDSGSHGARVHQWRRQKPARCPAGC